MAARRARSAGAGRAVRAGRPLPDEPRADPRTAARSGRHGARRGAAMSRIDDYRRVAPPGAVDFILKLAEQVKGRRFLHVTGGRLGGGATETLRAAVFALPGFEGRLGIPMYIVPPSIDPLSERNRDLTPRETSETLTALGVSRDKPLLVQIGRFARAHDPLGVVNAYRLVKKHHDVRLVLAGTADGEPERLELLSHLLEVAHEDHDVVVLELPPEAHRQVNALQRAATIVLMKSVRAGFDLGPAEAMWKGKPVVGGYAGGLAQQIVTNVTGYTVHSVEGAAFRIRHLLNNPELIPRMGAAGREHVRRSFLITRELVDDLALGVHLTR